MALMFVGVMFLMRHGFALLHLIGRPKQAQKIQQVTAKPVLDVFHQTVALLNRREQGVWDQQPEISAPLTQWMKVHHPCRPPMNCCEAGSCTVTKPSKEAKQVGRQARSLRGKQSWQPEGLESLSGFAVKNCLRGSHRLSAYQ
jgi:hypothetical protein